MVKRLVVGPYIDTYTMRPRAARDKWSDMGSAVLAMAENASKVSLVVFHPHYLQLWASTRNWFLCDHFVGSVPCTFQSWLANVQSMWKNISRHCHLQLW